MIGPIITLGFGPGAINLIATLGFNAGSAPVPIVIFPDPFAAPAVIAAGGVNPFAAKSKIGD